MSDATTALTKAIADAIYAKVPKQSQTSMPATYQGKDAEGKAWVLLPGATSPTPVKRMAVEAKQGDTVSVTVGNGRATVDSNISNPSAGLAGVKKVEKTANDAKSTAVQAIDYASAAQAAALAASQGAETAAAKADEAQESADTAHAAAETAIADAATAHEAAESAVQDAAIAYDAAASAKESADSAQTSAREAAYGLEEVEKVVGTVNWIAEHGRYVNQAGQTFDASKIYYTRSGTSPNYVYTMVDNPVAADIASYYILVVDESVQNYIASHVYLLNDGLYVTTDSTTGYKVRIDGDSVDVLDTSGTVVATFGATARVGKSAKAHVEIQPDSLMVSNDSGSDLLGIEVANTNYGNLQGPSIIANWCRSGNETLIAWLTNSLNSAGTAFVDGIEVSLHNTDRITWSDRNDNTILDANKTAFDVWVPIVCEGEVTATDTNSGLHKLTQTVKSPVAMAGEIASLSGTTQIWRLMANCVNSNNADSRNGHQIGINVNNTDLSVYDYTSSASIYRLYSDQYTVNTDTVADICSAASNITINSASYRERAGMACFEVKFTPSAAISSATTVFTLASGKRPALTTNGCDSSTTYCCLVNTSGTVQCRRALTSDTSYTFRATYLLA